ncbi:MAG TPA: ATP-dependent 6-phosphofructokinase [Thermoanaerobaculia bacterium]|nr:ATP-dependent 6-phosphofructokinase [Thermoanaerobaculia bacterium]
MADRIRRIAINTGGGDAPGLNAVIRAAVLSARRRGWEVLGIQRGYEGLLDTSKILQLDRASVRGITHLGGTIIGTTNRGNPFEYPMKMPDGQVVPVDRSDEVVTNFRRLGIDALITIGGDGSMRIAHAFAQKGLPVVGVPKTIDNDLEGTVLTFGFDTAVSVATEAIDRLHSTAEAHERVFVVELMGRYTGWIALHAGVAATADAILIPEIPFDIEAVCRKVMEREALGRHFSIVVAAEGARPQGGEMVVQGPKEVGREVRLGGIAEQVAQQIEECTGKESRTVVLGHVQRGGSPTAFDRLTAQRFGAAAVRLVAQRRFDTMVALDPPEVLTVPLTDAIGRMKRVPLEGDTIRTAREMGVCLGDEYEEDLR